MARKRKRSAFPNYDRPKMPEVKETYVADESIGGIFGFFRDFGTRETIESIVIAVILALMFRAFEAEAFIIPTGSMAPSLQGQHMDLECESCGYRYRTGASQESSGTARDRIRVEETYCPICQYKTRVRAHDVADHVSNSGDRILVNKFIYDFAEPERYDVIVFKNPNNGKQNYIKRLIGLPGDNVLIENGDIYLLSRDKDDDGWNRKISRKPPHKLHHVLQTVDDTNFIGKDLKRVGWPSRWQEFSGTDQWESLESGGNPQFVSGKTENPGWLRYRHFRPYKSDWQAILDNRLPERFQNNPLPKGRLIGDHYSYNDGLYSHRNYPETLDLGLHWVGDLGIECWAEVMSADGVLMLDLVEGGAHFTCRIDVASGQATLNCDDDAVNFQSATGEFVNSPVASTQLKGPGNYRIEFLNADDRINLWIDGELVEFDAAEYERDGIAMPKYTDADPGDAEPAGIAAENLEVRLTRLKIVRDIYYTSVWGTTKYVQHDIPNLADETEEADIGFILGLFANPDQWTSPKAVEFFRNKKGQTEPMFRLAIGENRDKGQFLPMGDNSPASLDGRVWDGPKYVERDMLIGRALFIYWPHTLNKPVKYFPNFGRMGFIR